MVKITYTDPASVEAIMDAGGSMRGILNTDNGMFIYMQGNRLHVKKGDIVVIDEQKNITIERAA